MVPIKNPTGSTDPATRAARSHKDAPRESSITPATSHGWTTATKLRTIAVPSHGRRSDIRLPRPEATSTEAKTTARAVVGRPKTRMYRWKMGISTSRKASPSNPK